jgi:hypothetical protein
VVAPAAMQQQVRLPHAPCLFWGREHWQPSHKGQLHVAAILTLLCLSLLVCPHRRLQRRRAGSRSGWWAQQAVWAAGGQQCTGRRVVWCHGEASGGMRQRPTPACCLLHVFVSPWVSCHCL